MFPPVKCCCGSLLSIVFMSDLWCDVFVQCSANSLHFSSRFNGFTREHFGCNSHGMLYLAARCRFLAWRFESCFRHVLNYLIFMFYWSRFLLGTQIACTLGLCFLFLLSFRCFLYFILPFFHIFSFIGYFTPQNSIGIFHCSVCSSIAVLFPQTVANLHLIVSPFCLWAYLLRQKWFSLFLSDPVYFSCLIVYRILRQIFISFRQ